MKAILLLFICFACACSQPLTVTTRSDQHTTTSGTLGSATFNNRLPEGTGDTARLTLPLIITDSAQKPVGEF